MSIYVNMSSSERIKEDLGAECYNQFLTWCEDNTITTRKILEIGRKLDPTVFGGLSRIKERNDFRGGRDFGREALCLWYELSSEQVCKYFNEILSVVRQVYPGLPVGGYSPTKSNKVTMD